ncbi:MAG: sigma 54-interacting transcriptional regulator, partial [Terriglobia bacterium]
MAGLQPWVTCLLTEMLIRHLEDQYPNVTRRVDYRKILSAAEVIQDIPDPHAFLTDPNNWVPSTVLGEVIKSCEWATGEKDFSYLAARAYYRAARRRTPTLLETIATLLKDVERVLSSAGHWASGYTNYLQMQAFAHPEEAQTLYILSQYRAPVEPTTGNTRLVQGNIEGIATLDPQVTGVTSEEQLSQVRLTTLVTEFGDKYVLHSKAEHTTVKERATGKAIAVAKSVVLGTECVPCPQPSLPTSMPSEEQFMITPDAQGRLSVFTPDSPTGPASARTGESTPTARGLRIERGGTLTNGSLRFMLREGAIYDAPYSRYRVQWQKAESAKGHVASGTRGAAAGEQEAFAYLLFNYLKNLQDTQRRTLGMVIRNIELAQENVQLKQELSLQQKTGGLIGKGKVMQDLLALIRTIAASDTTVLITGETGTGKELAARLIHQLSRRQSHRFVAVNCGALAETLLESELFGHERGAFTGAVSKAKGKFEVAEGGTLFLDEIGDVYPAVQVKLLRVLQEKEFQRVGGSVDL